MSRSERFDWFQKKLGIGRRRNPCPPRHPALSRERKLHCEHLEDRRLLATYGLGLDLAYPLTTNEIASLAAFESKSELNDYNDKSLDIGAGSGLDAGPLTFVLDFKSASQGNTSDKLGNSVSKFDVTTFGFL